MSRAIAQRAPVLVATLVVLAGVLPAAGHRSAGVVADAERWSTLDFPGADPGRAAATIDGDRVRLENDALAVEWRTPDQGAHLVAVLDKRSGAAISTGAEMFVLTLADGRVASASELKRVGPPLSSC